MNILENKKLEDYVIGLRRYFHMYPEISEQEFETTKKIKEELLKDNIEVVDIAENALVAIIKGSNTGKKIALRGDMDALPLQEDGEKEYASKNSGVMHACGHDGHVAMLLGAAKYLNSIKDSISGTIYCCFQPSEEIGKGAKEFLDYLKSAGGVDEVFAIHLWSLIPVGKISVSSGSRMANGDAFEITVVGRGGHGSRPDQCIDPLKVGARILLDITSIPVNRCSPLDPIVVTVGKFIGGSAGNVIPNTATLVGGYRSFSNENREKIPVLITEIAENIAKAHGAKAEINIMKGVPCVFNHKLSSERAEKTVTNLLGKEGLYDFGQLCASENFGFYTESYPGLLAFVGAGNIEKGITYPHHHPLFDIDEDSLITGTALYIQYALDFLSEK